MNSFKKKKKIANCPSRIFCFLMTERETFVLHNIITSFIPCISPESTFFDVVVVARDAKRKRKPKFTFGREALDPEL